MRELLAKSLDFSIRLIEFTRYLKDEGRPFPLSERLISRGNSAGVNLRMAEIPPAMERSVRTEVALLNLVECEYLLELAVATGYLTEWQSRPILDDCRSLKDSVTRARNDDKRKPA